MKVAIRYYSKFGHSEKMAKTIGAVIGVEPKTVVVPLSEPVDTLFIGAGAFMGKVNGAVVNFINALSPEMVKNVILFGSSAIVKPTAQMRELLKSKGIQCDEREFSCKGSMGPIYSGHPNAKDLKNLQSFVETLEIK